MSITLPILGINLGFPLMPVSGGGAAFYTILSSQRSGKPDLVTDEAEASFKEHTF